MQDPLGKMELTDALVTERACTKPRQMLRRGRRAALSSNLQSAQAELWESRMFYPAVTRRRTGVACGARGLWGRGLGRWISGPGYQRPRVPRHPFPGHTALASSLPMARPPAPKLRSSHCGQNSTASSSSVRRALLGPPCHEWIVERMALPISRAIENRRLPYTPRPPDS